jgi:hypothetical protein
MEQITIHINNKEKAELLLRLLRSLDFIDAVEVVDHTVTEESEADFFAMAGIWRGRDITQESLRQQAWPRQS